MSALVPCPDCGRHVRRSEATCPFCESAIEARIASIPERVQPTTRLSRSALYAFAVASVGVAACGGSTVTGADRSGRHGRSGDASTGGELGVPLYGGSFPIGGGTGSGGTGSGGNAPWDAGGGAPAYGTGGFPIQATGGSGPGAGGVPSGDVEDGGEQTDAAAPDTDGSARGGDR